MSLMAHEFTQYLGFSRGSRIEGQRKTVKKKGVEYHQSPGKMRVVGEERRKEERDMHC